MKDFADILRCPITERPLQWASETELRAEGGDTSHRYVDGVVRFLPEGLGSDLGAMASKKDTFDYYDSEGWRADEQGRFEQNKKAVDNRGASYDYTMRCIRRLGKYFRNGGEYLLDVGSGPMPHDELLRYGDAFEHRICLDLSVTGLQHARSKLGDRGVYLQGDLSKLPIKSNSIDAVTCNHVIYQIPTEEAQAAAFREIWRVLKPGGVAVVVYLWSYMPLAWRIENLVKKVVGDRSESAGEPSYSSSGLTPVHEPLTYPWFRAREWPFPYEIDTFRVVENAFMRTYVADDWRGRAFLNALYGLQVLAPAFCGKYGAIPAIIIRKTEESD